jgi:hypothetical protein
MSSKDEYSRMTPPLSTDRVTAEKQSRPYTHTHTHTHTPFAKTEDVGSGGFRGKRMVGFNIQRLVPGKVAGSVFTISLFVRFRSRESAWGLGVGSGGKG